MSVIMRFFSAMALLGLSHGAFADTVSTRNGDDTFVASGLPKPKLDFRPSVPNAKDTFVETAGNGCS